MKKQNGANLIKLCVATGAMGLALGMSSQAVAREGAFLGAGAGWSSNKVEVGTGGAANLDGLAADGLGGTVFAGYGWRSIHGFFAIEANMGMRDAEAEETVRSGGATLKTRVESDVSYGLLADFQLRDQRSRVRRSGPRWRPLRRGRVAAAAGQSGYAVGVESDALQ
jgi:hypothetical protein